MVLLIHDGHCQPNDRPRHNFREKMRRPNAGQELREKPLGNLKARDRGADNLRRRGSEQHVPPRIADSEACSRDVAALCRGKVSANNFAVLDCLQEAANKDGDNTGQVSQACNNYLWNYKKNLTQDLRFDQAASEVCDTDLKKLPECGSLPKGEGQVIPCLLEHKENVTNAACQHYLSRMASIVFSDYRLIKGFYDDCHHDIDKALCGSVGDVYAEKPGVHSQGKVINCLEQYMGKVDKSAADKVSERCRLQVLRAAELSSNDYHLDRALYFACRNDRERFCADTQAGNGQIYKCLIKNKFRPDMSEACREKLTVRQKLASEDYKVNYRLQKVCKADIKKNRCEYLHIRNRHSKLSFILLCLENIKKKGKKLNSECQQEMKDTRKSLMEDYQINPEVMLSCRTEIQEKCNGLEREGKTLHCLMDNAKRDNFNKKSSCMKALDDLIKETNAGEDISVDTQLQKACNPVIQTACQNIRPGDSNIMSCLMEKIQIPQMTEECRTHLLQLQYFIARNFKLDPKLFSSCQEDASFLCGVVGDWSENTTDTRSPGKTLACLHQFLHPNDEGVKLNPKCGREIHRVLRQRAIDVKLNPRIDMACREVLGAWCREVGSGEEISCLQDKYDMLEGNCRYLVGNFTAEESEDVKLDRALIRVCSPMLNKFCKEFMEATTDEGNLMSCLVKHKPDPEMTAECAASIEHLQLLQLQDYRFSFKFKQACKRDVMQYCRNTRNKADIINCLSTRMLNATLYGEPQKISSECQNQLRAQLVERSENIRLDPELREACLGDYYQFCLNLEEGKSKILECLKDNKKELTDSCHMKVFNRQKQETLMPKLDFSLIQSCKQMIKQFCSEAEPSSLFQCLKKHKNEPNMEPKCKQMIIKRQIEKAGDYRLNSGLQKACTRDIPKFCHDAINSIEARGNKNKEFEGAIIECLKVHFRKSKLSHNCEIQVKALMQESAIDFRLDSKLRNACRETTRQLCANELEDPGAGLVEECLKRQLQKKNIKNKKCQDEVIRLLQEGHADIDVDPVLYKSCAMDIKHYCVGIPQGEGRQMSCMLEALEDKAVRLSKECRQMLEKRKEMWEYAAKIAPPDSVMDLWVAANSSPNRHYFLFVVCTFTAAVLFFGMFCGRFTKRVSRSVKNK